MDEITVLSSNFPRDKNVKLYFQVYKNKKNTAYRYSSQFYNSTFYVIAF